ncbi:MAG: phospholipase [Rickettsiales bacterium]|nr:phospholipase [Rickettsiales bacterium]
MTEILKGPILKSIDKTENIVVFLHGYGANGNDLIEIGKHWQQNLPSTLFLSPNAPFNCEWGENAYQWFDLTSIAPEKIGEGLQKAGPYLNQYLDHISDFYKIVNEKILVVGFSQGTMMALHHLCKRKKECAGLIGYSGLLFENEGFDSEVTSKFPIRLYHGKQDEVINYEFTEKASKKLKSLGFSVDYDLNESLGHGIDENGLDFGLSFIKKTFYV